MFRRALPLVLIVMIAACGKDSPSSPTPPSTPTPIIRMLGDLNFGDVEVGAELTRPFQVINDGTAPLSVSGMAINNASQFSATPTTGTVQPGQALNVTLFFRPTSTGDFSGTLRVDGNQVSGTNTMAVTARGVRTGPLWTRSGQGNTVFDMPTGIARVHIRGEWNQRDTSNFVVRIGGRLVVNEVLRQSIVYEGTHLTQGATVVEVSLSNQIAWTFTEVR